MGELHFFFVMGTIALVLFADHEAFNWFRGKHELLPTKKLALLHKAVWAGLIAVTITGFFAMWPGREYYLAQPFFVIKMLFVGVLYANSFLLGSIMHIASTRTYASLTIHEKIPLFFSGAVSFISWASALLIGLIFLG